MACSRPPRFCLCRAAQAKEITVVDGKVDEKASKEALDAFLKGKTTQCATA
jgi:hypothetical protein